VFYKWHKKENIVISIHVGDALISSTSDRGIDYCERIFGNAFHAVNITRGASIEYLGMQLTSSNDGISVDMPGYAKECVDMLSKWDSTSTFTSPGDSKLFTAWKAFPKIRSQ
jgi:hypothetical protein